MPNYSKTLEIVINAKNQAAPAFAKLEGYVSSMEKNIFNLKNALTTGFVGLAIKDAIDASNQLNNALIGLNSVSNAFGQNAEEAKKAAILLASDGLMSVKSAADSLKNLLASGFSLPEAINLMNAFKDSAAFNRQGTLEFGQAIEGATQGIKNQNSIMVDNAGITKNLSIILAEAGYSAQDLGKVTTDNKVRMALYNGILKEASAFQGDAARSAETLSGKQAALATKIFTVKAAIGEGLAPTVSEIIGKINVWIDKMGGPEGITKRTEQLIRETKELIEELKPLLEIIGGGVGLIWAISKATAVAKGLEAGLALLAFQSKAASASVSTLRLAVMGLPMGITIAVALAGYTLVMNQIKNLKREIGEQAESELDLHEMRMDNINKYKEMKKSEDKDVQRYAQAQLDMAFDLIKVQDQGAQIDLSNSRSKIAEIKKELEEKGKLSLVQKDLNNETEKLKNNTGALEFPASFGEGTKKAKEETDKLSAAWQKYGEEINTFSEKSLTALGDLGEKIKDISSRMNSLLVDNAKETLGLNQNLAEAYINQEKKVSDLKAQWQSEDDQTQKDALFQELQREQEVLAQKKTIELAYHNEVAEARRRASLTDFERTLEDLEKKRILLNKEFEEKKVKLENELKLELTKLAKINEINVVAAKEQEKFLAKSEIATVESINRQIESYNKLAKAIANASSGKTSSYVGVSSESLGKSNQIIPNVNITITGNTLLDSQAAEKMGDMIVNKLGLTTKLSY